MGNLGNGRNVGDVVSGVTNALNVDSLSLVVDGGSNILRLVSVYELGFNTQSREENLELVVCATVPSQALCVSLSCAFIGES